MLGFLKFILVALVGSLIFLSLIYIYAQDFMGKLCTTDSDCKFDSCYYDCRSSNKIDCKNTMPTGAKIKCGCRLLSCTGYR